MSTIFGSLAASLILVGAPVDDRTLLVRTAKEMKFFSANAVLYDRNNGLHILPKEWQDNWQQARAVVDAPKFAVADLLRLLKDKDAKVRTLALAALAHRQDPKLLPHLAALMQDKEKTSPALQPYACAWTGGPPPSPPLMDQTVGQVAFQFVHFWMLEANYHRPEEFGAYWAPRKDRDFCASWFNARFVAIVQNTLPLDKVRADRVRALRKELDRLPPVDRDWTLLWLVSKVDNDFYSHAIRYLATPEELLQAGKRLGAERLMNLLQGKKISDDPDLDTDQRSRASRQILTVYVLKRSRQFLRPSDADAVLAVEKTFPTTPWCAIAAAELQPAKAIKILHDAMDRFAGEGSSLSWPRAELAAALCRLAGQEEMDYLVDWFYREKAELNPCTTQTQIFLEALTGTPAPANRDLLARLIADPRFDKLDYHSLQGLVLTVNRWLKKPLLPQDERYWHGKNVQGLAEWRRKLKESVPAWKK